MFTATLIAANGLPAGEVSAAADRLAAAGCTPSPPRWIDAGAAVDLDFAGDPVAARAALEGAFAGVDLVVQPSDGRRKALLVADMDSTMITVECIDELADTIGLRAQVSAITERAMRGEIAFGPALRERVARGDLGMKTGRGFFDWPEDRRRAERARYDTLLRQGRLGRVRQRRVHRGRGGAMHLDARVVALQHRAGGEEAEARLISAANLAHLPRLRCE